MIQLLPREEVEKLDSIFEAEWGACLPDSEFSNVVAEIEDEELISFIVLESVILAHCIYVAPNHRGVRGVKSIRNLMTKIQQRAERSGRTFLMIGHEGKPDRLIQGMGFRRVADSAFRKDFWR